jgi:hypothetical protein
VYFVEGHNFHVEWHFWFEVQKTANLAPNLCKNGGEKDPMPFTKVVEDWEIYNFAIHRLGHLCSKI